MTYVAATKNQSMNQHVDPKRKANVDNGGFTKVKDTRRKSSRRLNYATPRRPKRNNFNNDCYVPQFHGYCYKCNTYGHRIVNCNLMHRSPPSFGSRNQFASLRDRNVIYYHCNGYNHRIHECRRKVSQSYTSFSNSSFNVNVKCYHCQNLGHFAKHCKLRTIKQKKVVSTLEPKVNLDQETTVESKIESK